MITRKTEILLGLYTSEEDRIKEKDDMLSNGYEVLEMGVASFSKEDVEATGIEAGEICLFAKYVKTSVVV